MTNFSFQTEKIDASAKKIRKQGKIPAILYGKKFANIKLAVEQITFNRLFKDAGSSNLIDLNVGDGSVKVLIHEVQLHPLNGRIMHIDFLKIDMKEKIKTEVPLEIVGETALVIEQEGSLISNKDTVEVECLPNDLVDHIKVDVSVLTDFEQNIKVSDLKAPQGIEILDDPEEVVVSVQPPRSDEELESLNEAVVEDVEKVEVLEKGKEEEVAEDKEGAESAEKAEETKGAKSTEKSSEVEKEKKVEKKE